jgi:hypothetical protein
MKKILNLSFAALLLSLFVLLIAFLTAIIDTPTVLNRIQTTIIAWHLPMATIVLLVCGVIRDKEDKLLGIFRYIALCALLVGFFLTNVTKNVFQDVLSNTGKYVDVAVATIEKESANVVGYGLKLENALESAEKKIKREVMRQEIERYEAERYEAERREATRNMSKNKVEVSSGSTHVNVPTVVAEPVTEAAATVTEAAATVTEW